jgi:hypothetical protein
MASIRQRGVVKALKVKDNTKMYSQRLPVYKKK